MALIINIIVSALSVLIAGYLVPGVEIDNFFTAVVVAVVLGILNAIVKPILILLTLPINVLTLGLFTLVINTLMILLTDFLIEGFSVESFLAALIFSIVLAVINTFFSLID